MPIKNLTPQQIEKAYEGLTEIIRGHAVSQKTLGINTYLYRLNVGRMQANILKIKETKRCSIVRAYQILSGAMSEDLPDSPKYTLQAAAYDLLEGRDHSHLAASDHTINQN